MPRPGSRLGHAVLSFVRSQPLLGSGREESSQPPPGSRRYPGAGEPCSGRDAGGNSPVMRDAGERLGEAARAGQGRPIGLGIVGCGDLAQQAVLPHLAQPDALPLARVAAMCSRTLDRAQALAERYHVPHVTTEYEALLADEAVAAVLIRTPARLHLQQALAAVRARKHVYVQKPLTEALQEALPLEREVQRQGVRLVAAPGQSLNPLVPQLREALQSGTIGPLFWVN